MFARLLPQFAQIFFSSCFLPTGRNGLPSKPGVIFGSESFFFLTETLMLPQTCRASVSGGAAEQVAEAGQRTGVTKLLRLEGKKRKRKKNIAGVCQKADRTRARSDRRELLQYTQRSAGLIPVCQISTFCQAPTCSITK